MNIADTIVAKSDQLNADDLVGGPITVQIQGASRGAVDQPVVIKITGGHQPWKPCKTTRRILVAAWGPETDAWLGRWVTLHRDERVKWAGEEVGGIRIAAMSHIDERGQTLSLAISKGKKSTHHVKFLRDPKQYGAPTAKLADVLGDAELTEADFDRWRAAEGKPLHADLTGDQRAALAVWLAADPKRLDAIRALIPQE